MPHASRTRIFTCLLLTAATAVVGGCQSGDKAAPASKDPTLYGQSVPDKFAVPKPTSPGEPVKVRQTESLLFTFEVEGKPGDDPVALVILRLKTDAATSPFEGGKNEFTMSNVPIGPNYTFKVPIDSNAALHDYNVKASLWPYDTENPSEPSVQSFTIKVEAKVAGVTPDSTAGK